MNKNISRKDFLKNFGLATLSVPSLAAFTNSNIAGDQKDEQKISLKNNQKKEWKTRRGSWVRKGDVVPGDVLLAKEDKGCKIIINEKENSAVQQAARFLSEDIKKISGYQPEIITQQTTDNRQQTTDNQQQTTDNRQSVTIHLITLGNGTIPPEIDTSEIKDKWEAHKIVTTGDAVWLIGADFRGTAFAVYTLCERLGIDPLYLWTGYTPEQHKTLALKKTNYTATSPTFKYRGFFHDDEDILPRPFEWSGYPLRIGDIDILWYQKYFETALRLRLNMVAPYTRVHRRYEVQKCAGDWGLIYTSHHYDILLSNPFGFLRFNLAEKRNVKPVWDWFKNKEGMIKFWRGGVWENKDLDCIWPVGLRGTNDYGYPFPKGMTEQQQAEVFNHVIDIQVNTVKEILPCSEPPVYTFTLWSEMMNKYESDRKAFHLPEDAIIVWSDNMNGVMDRLPKSLGKWKHGIYYHLAMYGGGVTKQGTHIVSPLTVTKEFKKAVDAGATEYMLVNVSELRDYIMEARLIAEICWDAPSMLNKNDPGNAYVNWWCNEYFGPNGTEEAASVYSQYYEILNEPTRLWFAADIIWHLLEALVNKFKGEKYNPVKEEDITLLKSRARKYDSVMKLFSKSAEQMAPAQRQYFFENTKLGLSFDWRPTQAALLLHQALIEKDKNKAWEYILQSVQPLEQLELEILKAERPPFDKWYRETWIRGKLTPLNVHRSYDLVRAFISSEGKESKPPKRNGHDNIPQSQAWTKFIEESEKINDPLSRS